jgi:hypothetical protein
MKMQAYKLADETGFWSTPRHKGSLYFDILGYTGHKKYRDYYPFIIGEFEVILLMALIICAFSFSPITQSIILIILALAALVSVVMLNQFQVIKYLKIGWHAFLVIFYVMVLIVAMSPQVSTGVAATLSTILLILLFTLLIGNLGILFYRLYDLMNDAASTYGEKAKPIPPLKQRPLNGSPFSQRNLC